MKYVIIILGISVASRIAAKAYNQLRRDNLDQFTDLSRFELRVMFVGSIVSVVVGISVLVYMMLE